MESTNNKSSHFYHKKNNWNNLDNYLIDGQLLELFQLSLLFSCDVVV